MMPSINHTMMGNGEDNYDGEEKAILEWVYGPLDFDRLVFISLAIQLILFFGAPFRKSTTSGVVHSFIWLAYLLADMVSYYAVTLLLNGQDGPDSYHIHVIWGSLLIAHMSGPDTISALDMEDHKLWSRTALKFGTIAYSVARVSIKTFTQFPEGPIGPIILVKLNVPTVALYFVGVIKSLEKIATLVFNRTAIFQDGVLNNIRANPRNSKLLQGGAVLVEIEKKLKMKKGEKSRSQFDIVRDAYQLFQLFQGSFVDLKLEIKDAGQSIREYFLHRISPEEAFQMIEMELNLAYDVFYTKAGTFRLLAVRFVRYLTVIVEIVAFACLASSWIPVTHILVVGALFMDINSTLGIIFSIRSIMPADDDRFLNWLHQVMKMPAKRDEEYGAFSFRGSILNTLLNARRRTWGKRSSTEDIPILQWVRRMLFRRWSESISQFNWIDYGLRRHSSRLQRAYNILGVKEKINMATNVSEVWFTDSLRDFIISELKSKVSLLHHQESLSESYAPWTVQRELDECLLVWHIATDLCCTDVDSANDECREWSTTLSNYMLYLLVQYPKMLKRANVAVMGKLRLESACKKADQTLNNDGKWLPGKNRSKLHNEARQKLLSYLERNATSNCNVMDEAVCEGYHLAKEMNNLGSEKWKTISKVWVELLCRTAAESKPSTHIRTLNTGGELFTIVWLLMNHLGIGIWERSTTNTSKEHCVNIG